MFSCCSLVQIIVSAVRARGQKLMPSVRTGAVETSTVGVISSELNICVKGFG